MAHSTEADSAYRSLNQRMETYDGRGAGVAGLSQESVHENTHHNCENSGAEEPGNETRSIEFDCLSEGAEHSGGLQSEEEPESDGKHEEAEEVALRGRGSRPVVEVVFKMGDHWLVGESSQLIQRLLQKEHVPVDL